MTDGTFVLDCKTCGITYDNAPLIAERDDLRARLAAAEKKDTATGMGWDRRVQIRALWKKHGGGWYGPHVEHFNIPEESGFWPFIAELDAERNELQARLVASEAALKTAREEEREACACLIETMTGRKRGSITRECAQAIRARSQSPQAKL